MAKDTEIMAVTAQDFVLLHTDLSSVLSVLSDNLADGTLSVRDLDRITVPAGGSTTWSIATLNGTEDTKALDGVIVYWRDGRAFWRKGFEETGSGTPPDCISYDGVVGEGDPGGACVRCPMSQFGSAERVFGRRGSSAQACRATRLLFVLRPSDMLPVIVRVPPSSLKEVRGYFIQLTRAGLPYYAVVTRLTLERDKNASGIVYSKIKPIVLHRLSPDQARIFAAYGEQLRHAIEGGSGSTAQAPAASSDADNYSEY